MTKKIRAGMLIKAIDFLFSNNGHAVYMPAVNVVKEISIEIFPLNEIKDEIHIISSLKSDDVLCSSKILSLQSLKNKAYSFYLS